MVTENKALTDFMKREMPEGTVIGNARYWSLRISGFLDTPTPPAEAQGVGGREVERELQRLRYQAASLERRYGMGGAAENIREATDKLEAALSAQPRPASASVGPSRFYLDHGVVHDRKTGKHVGADFEGDSAERLLVLLRQLENESDSWRFTAKALDAYNKQSGPSAPVGVEAYIEKLEGRVRGFRSSKYGKGKQDGIRECLEDARALAQQPKAAPVGVGVDVVREYLDARACYEDATRPPNSHAPAPTLKHNDPNVLRLREARCALDEAIALSQRPAPVAPVGAYEIVALALDEHGHHTEADNVRKGIDLQVYSTELAAVRIALAQKPAAVDEAMVARLADQLIARHWDIDPDCDGTGIVELRDALSAALAQPQGASHDQ